MNSIAATHIREFVIAILAFLLWGWQGVIVAFLGMFLLNMVMTKLAQRALNKMRTQCWED